MRGVLSVPQGETLHVDPCATVQFEEDAGLSATLPGSRIEIAGEPSREVTLAPRGSARWDGIEVVHPAEALIGYTRIRGAGSNEFHDHATLMVRGDGEMPTKTPVLIGHVDIEGSEGPGIKVERAAGFHPLSEGLNIHGSGSDEHPYPLVVGEHTLTSIPDGQYTGNKTDEILIVAEGANSSLGLREDATIRDRGVPYRTSEESSLTVGIDSSATLTIDKGVRIRFSAGTRIAVHDDGDIAPGALRIQGTADKPVVLGSASDSPRPGDWAGLYFYGRIDDRTWVEHTTIEYAGGYCSCSLLTCNDTGTHDAAVILNALPDHDFFHDNRIAHSAGHG
ncbi:MAG: hypothetical protein KDA28_10460, partial [Phycisphaerales bacterium]|nr:hypothetical protein [Phycisphaerales bacterium]